MPPGRRPAARRCRWRHPCCGAGTWCLPPGASLPSPKPALRPWPRCHFLPPCLTPSQALGSDPGRKAVSPLRRWKTRRAQRPAEQLARGHPWAAGLGSLGLSRAPTRCQGTPTPWRQHRRPGSGSQAAWLVEGEPDPARSWAHVALSPLWLPPFIPNPGPFHAMACVLDTPVGTSGAPLRLPTAPTTPTPARPSRSQARSRLIQGQNPAGPLNSQPAPRLPPAPSSRWPAEPRGPSTEEPAPGRCRCACGDVDLGRQEPLGQHRGPPRRASRRRWQPCGPQAGHLAVTRPAPFWSVLEDGAGRRKGPARLLLARSCRSRENCPVSVDAMTP